MFHFRPMRIPLISSFQIFQPSNEFFPMRMFQPSCRFYSVEMNSWAKFSPMGRLVLCDDDIREQFVKGSGKGGQKINKVRNCVLLKHLPTGSVHSYIRCRIRITKRNLMRYLIGTIVRCQQTRCLSDNRAIARNMLLSKLDTILYGDESKQARSIKKTQKSKARKYAKAKKKVEILQKAKTATHNLNPDDMHENCEVQEETKTTTS